jgi:hypothetical protein
MCDQVWWQANQSTSVDSPPNSNNQVVPLEIATLATHALGNGRQVPLTNLLGTSSANRDLLITMMTVENSSNEITANENAEGVPKLLQMSAAENWYQSSAD